MGLLDILLGHDDWTTRQVLHCCDEPPPEVARVVYHMIHNVRVWTDLMASRPTRETPRTPVTQAALLAAWSAAYAEFAAVARQVEQSGGWDETYLDVLDQPPTRKSKGGTIAHVITHNMHHRGELLRLLRQHGVADLPEGDVLGWQMTVGGATP